jgi:RNA polymerase sigma-70 factor, ECF subfamily
VVTMLGNATACNVTTGNRSLVADISKTPTGPAATDARMRELYQAHATALHRFLLNVSFGAQQSAEDLVQETLVRAWRNLDRLGTEVDALRPWLITVARRIAIDSARARRARPAEDAAVDTSLMPETDDPIERLGTIDDVRTALRQLPERQRQVLVEIFYRGRSVTETALVLGIPVGTVKSRSFNALRALRSLVDSGRQ